MPVTIEFFGIPRQRAGTPRTTVASGSLADVLHELAARFPEFADDCLAVTQQEASAIRLRPLYVANLGGDRFVTDPATSLSDGDCLMILSADAGG